MGCPLTRKRKQKKNPVFIFKSVRVFCGLISRTAAGNRAYVRVRLRESVRLQECINTELDWEEKTGIWKGFRKVELSAYESVRWRRVYCTRTSVVVLKIRGILLYVAFRACNRLHLWQSKAKHIINDNASKTYLEYTAMQLRPEINNADLHVSLFKGATSWGLSFRGFLVQTILKWLIGNLNHAEHYLWTTKEKKDIIIIHREKTNHGR